MIDWTDGFEILSLMGVDKGWNAVYIQCFCDMDIIHGEIVHMLLVAVELISEFRKFWNRFHFFVSNPMIQTADDNELFLHPTHSHIDASPSLEESLVKRSTS